jgi:hypothetical protein
MVKRNLKCNLNSTWSAGAHGPLFPRCAWLPAPLSCACARTTNPPPLPPLLSPAVFRHRPRRRPVPTRFCSRHWSRSPRSGGGRGRRSTLSRCSWQRGALPWPVPVPVPAPVAPAAPAVPVPAPVAGGGGRWPTAGWRRGGGRRALRCAGGEPARGRGRGRGRGGGEGGGGRGAKRGERVAFGWARARRWECTCTRRTGAWERVLRLAWTGPPAARACCMQPRCGSRRWLAASGGLWMSAVVGCLAVGWVDVSVCCWTASAGGREGASPPAEGG